MEVTTVLTNTSVNSSGAFVQPQPVANRCGCLHGGTCKTFMAYCVCPSGFSGKRCQHVDIDFSFNPFSEASKEKIAGIVAGGFALLILLMISIVAWRRCRKIRKERKIVKERCRYQSRSTIEGFSTVNGSSRLFSKQNGSAKDHASSDHFCSGINDSFSQTIEINDSSSCEQPVQSGHNKKDAIIVLNEGSTEHSINFSRRKRINAESHSALRKKESLQSVENTSLAI